LAEQGVYLGGNAHDEPPPGLATVGVRQVALRVPEPATYDTSHAGLAPAGSSLPFGGS